MFKKKFFLIISLIIICNSCKNKYPNKIEIDLHKETDKNILFNKLYTTIEFSSKHQTYPEYYNYLLKNYKGLPESDSLYILYNNADYRKFLANLYTMGFLDKKKIKLNKIDLNEEKSKPELKQMSLLTYFKNKKQHLVIDRNQNWDFSDDKILQLDSKLKDKDLKETLNYKFWQKIDSNVTFYNREIELIPSSLNFKNKKNNISEISFKLKDYQKGSFKFNDETFDVVINGVYPYLDIFIKPSFINFSESNYYFNLNLKYNLKDTISLKDSLFILDKINPKTTKLTLKKIKTNKKFKSNKIGNNFYDFTLSDLDNKNFNISDFTTKKYTLIDFWGTWCTPCKKTTPKLKSMNLKYAHKLNIIGVAYDKDSHVVNEYITKNKINWINSFSKRDKRTGIIKDLKITKYPTFILLDSKNRIIYKGPGDESLIEIESIINEN
jgi:thiol-disulfide isomerase/thioredoxin